MHSNRLPHTPFRRIVVGFALAGVLVMSSAAAVPDSPSAAIQEDPLVRPVEKAADIHGRTTTGRMRELNMALTPCFAGRATAFATVRRSDGVWAGDFRVERAGTGQWTLVVQSVDGARRWSRAVSELPGAGAAAQRSEVMDGSVRVSLVGPADATAICPLVRLERELEEFIKAEPRGVVGLDDRWSETAPALLAQPDAQSIRRWASSVAHLRVLTSTNFLIPCTGFFITSRVLVTAAHCIGSRSDAASTSVFMDDREIAGADLDLLMAQGDLDFTLLWLKGAGVPNSLTVGTASDNRLVIWQEPVQNEKLVSVQGCVMQTASGRQITHKCDTVPGASGSPVQSRATGNVVGLHTSGCTQSNGTDNCVNFALNVEEIRKRVFSLEKRLREHNPMATEELIGALK